MAVNLLTLAKSYLNDGVVSQVSTMLGENQQNTQKAFDGALPALLGSLVQTSSEPSGTRSIMDMIGEVTSSNRAVGGGSVPSGGLTDQLSNLLSGGLQSSSLLAMGAPFVQRLFGEKAGAAASALAFHSGLKQSSASSLLSLSAPILLSLLGKKVADEGTGVSGLGTLLAGQSTYVQSAMPSGLASLFGSIPGLGFLGESGSKLNAVSAPVRPVPAPVHTGSDNRSSGGGNRWLPWLLLVLGVLALLYFLRSCGNDRKETVSTTTGKTLGSTSSVISTVADSLDSKASAALDSAGDELVDVTAKLGAFFKRKLPSGHELTIPEFGMENNLVKFIEDKSKPVDKTTWFNFDRLLFATGKSTLKPSSQEQLTNIASILKAFPNVTIKLGGYTDNTGSAATNKKLSQERAESVMGELVKLGVDKSRLEAEGYGQEHPVASNATEAGRAENRRIAIRVTKK